MAKNKMDPKGKRFVVSCFKLFSMIFTDVLIYQRPQQLSSYSKDRLLQATNCCVDAKGESDGGEDGESRSGSASVERDEGGGGEEKGKGGEAAEVAGGGGGD